MGLVPGARGETSRNQGTPLTVSAPDVFTPTPVPTPEGPAYASGFIRDIAVVYENGEEHAENVELHLLPSEQMLSRFAPAARARRRPAPLASASSTSTP